MTRPRTLTDEQRAENNRASSRKAYIAKPYKDRAPASRLLWAAKRRATERGLAFDLVVEDIVVPTHCPYLKVPLVWHSPKGTSRKQVASLDRINPSLGYVKDNVEVISHLANTMKNNATVEELVSFAKTILERHD